ncbi:MAG: thermonuclease family protein, partial [Thermoplasmata archaeon]
MMRKSIWVVVIVATVIVVSVAGVYIGVTLAPLTSTSPLPPPPPPPQEPDCPNTVGLWVYCEVTRVLDGDTLDIEDGRRIRLVLVDAPGLSEPGGPEARDYLTDL